MMVASSPAAAWPGHLLRAARCGDRQHRDRLAGDRRARWASGGRGPHRAARRGESWVSHGAGV